MQREMRIALLQSDIAWADAPTNVAAADAAIAAAPGADLYVLPEMFSTGFCTDPVGIAEDAPAASLDWMRRRAAALGAAIAGSVALHVDGQYRNRFYLVEPSGTVHHYDKHHLFTYGGEHLSFTAGDERVVVAYRGVRILLQVCYDLRFPVWARSRGDYDLILYVANWPESRIGAWNTLLRARAIENQCYVAGVNRVGHDPAGNHYSGGTAMIDPWGKTLAACPDGAPSAAVVDVDMEALEAFRAKFPVLADGDEFELG